MKNSSPSARRLAYFFGTLCLAWLAMLAMLQLVQLLDSLAPVLAP